VKWSLEEAKRQGMPEGHHYCEYIMFLDADQVMPPAAGLACAWASMLCQLPVLLGGAPLPIQHGCTREVAEASRWKMQTLPLEQHISNIHAGCTAIFSALFPAPNTFEACWCQQI